MLANAQLKRPRFYAQVFESPVEEAFGYLEGSQRPTPTQLPAQLTIGERERRTRGALDHARIVDCGGCFCGIVFSRF